MKELVEGHIYILKGHREEVPMVYVGRMVNTMGCPYDGYVPHFVHSFHYVTKPDDSGVIGWVVTPRTLKTYDIIGGPGADTLYGVRE